VSSASIESLGPELVPKLSATRAELLDEYRQSHHHPWIIGYSGGKDSTLVVQLAFEMLLDLPPTERDRPIHVVANDTLVESPLVVAHINRTIEQFRGAAEALPADCGLPHTPRSGPNVLGQPDRSGLPLAQPQLPLVYRPDENSTDLSVCA
jgi:3'-phosphoadenosine 5'-phosphosulfate sulfotransferase (PAPS reductase)/FAD synthetase